MTEIGKKNYQNNIEQVRTRLDEVRGKFEEHKAKQKENCSVATDSWCGSKEGYSEHISLKYQMNFLTGKLKALQEMLQRFIEQSKSKPKEEEVPAVSDAEPETVSSTEPEVTQPEVAPTEATPVDQYSFLDQAAFRDFTKGFLKKSKGEKISEEQLQWASVNYLVKNLHGKEASNKLVEARGKVKGLENGIENGTKRALQALVDVGTISQQEAERINGLTFQAAQLDGNRKALGGHKARMPRRWE